MARRLGLGKAAARRTRPGTAKISLTVPYELAWRLGVKSKMSRAAPGDVCPALSPLVEGEQLPWDRYKARLLDAPKDAPPDASGEGGGKLVDGTLTVTGDVTPPAPIPAVRGGEKGRKDPAEVRGGDQAPQGRVRPPCSVLGLAEHLT